MEWLSKQFELSRHGGGQHLRPMEGLRGLAVFLVFLVHYATLIGPWVGARSSLDQVRNSVHMAGNAGVDLFFVLSGYLIYGTLISRPQNFPRFIGRRVARIYPAFCVVFAIYLLLSLVRPADSKLPSQPLAAWTYVLQNFLLLPGLFPIEPIISVAWSLSYEMFYYLAVPLVIVLFGLRKRSAALRACFFLAVAAAIAAYCAVYGGHVRLIMFVAGILLHEALRKPPVAPPRDGYALALLAAGLLASTMPFTGPAAFTVKTIILFAAFFMVCYACFLTPEGWLARGFCWTPLRWLGNMSYSYYLLHGLALKAGFLALTMAVAPAPHGALFSAAMLPLMFMLTLLPSAALFLLVERPFSLAAPVKTAPPAMPAQMRA
ncbi:acyltransferase [Pseudoduganella sp. LjRoot289]|uniref:acyltransferase family protein n=1 Tax=Pseudoduganella sp. LjRoot289 TaxID=3342314 RepID=UPI003ED11AEB